MEVPSQKASLAKKCSCILNGKDSTKFDNSRWCMDEQWQHLEILVIQIGIIYLIRIEPKFSLSKLFLI